MQSSLLVSKFWDASVNKALKTIDQQVTEEEVRSLKHKEDYVSWLENGGGRVERTWAQSLACVSHDQRSSRKQESQSYNCKELTLANSVEAWKWIISWSSKWNLDFSFVILWAENPDFLPIQLWGNKRVTFKFTKFEMIY